MNVSVRANARVAEAARGGVAPALSVAFRGGAITGMLVVGLALFGVAGYYGLLTSVFDRTEGSGRRAHRPGLRRLAHLRLRSSGRRHLHQGRRRRRRSRRQGGSGHPRGRPRNPAVIADNVGDNVGDCAGMAADLFETYAVTAVAIMLLGVLTFQEASAVALYPLVLGGVAIIASIIGTFAVRSAAGNVERALYQGLILSGLIAAVAFYPVTAWMMDDLSFRSTEGNVDVPGSRALPLRARGHRRHRAAVRHHRLLHVHALQPGEEDRRCLADGPRDEHHPGAGSGPAGHRAARDRARARHPRLLEARRRRHGGHLRDRRGGHGPALADRPDRRPGRVRPDHRQRGRDRRDGGPPRGVRNVTDPLDAVGNTTKAVTKGYAIGSAVLAAVVLFAGFTFELRDEGLVPRS